MACLHIDVGIQAAILGIAGALAGMGLLALATERRSLPLESRLKNRLKTD
jgi:hypothetical protein